MHGVLQHLVGVHAFEALSDDEKLALEAVPPGDARLDLYRSWWGSDAEPPTEEARAQQEAAQEAAEKSAMWQFVAAVHMFVPNAVWQESCSATERWGRFNIGPRTTDEFRFTRLGAAEGFDPLAEAAKVVTALSLED